MKRTIVLGGLMLAATHGTGHAQVLYDVRFPNAVHHEAEISVTFTDLPARPLELRMSRSSPGRYALHEFAKNVYAVRVVGPDGEPLRVTRPNPYQWDVPQHGDTVRVSYTLFADRAGGTYSQVDETHAHFNIPATFMWARGLGDRAIRVTFHPPDGSGWRAATQLMPTTDPMVYTAPNLYYFLDSPTELSAFSMRQWPLASGDTMRMAIHHAGTEEEVDTFVEWTKRVVDQQIAVFGEAPDFDGGTYTFIADYLPYASGDGMEHRNSTILASTQSIGRAGRRLLGTVSHEFFHAWNVERIRPRSLEPFDFERANMSGELWFAEGFTSYYTQLFIRRAGLTTDAEYARTLGGGVSFVVNAAGRRYFSPIEMSMQAPFVDAATAVDPNNRGNTFISYYTWGSVIGLNLDLTLRSRFDRSLDGFMRAVWVRFGKTEIPYTVDDLQQTLATFTDDEGFAEEFFTRYVRGSSVPDYAALLAHAGFSLQPSQPDAAWMGTMNFQYRDGGAILSGMPPEGSPLYEAGISRGAKILSIGGEAPENANALRRVLGAHRPGDSVEVTFEQRGSTKTVEMLLAPNPQLVVVLYEDAGMAVTPEMTAFRAAWLTGSN